MNTFLNYFDQLSSKPIFDNVIIKMLLIIIMAFVAWIILRVVTSFIEKKSGTFKIIQFSDQVFRLIKKMLGLIIFFMAGTYIIQIANIPLVEKMFLAVFVLLVSGPVNGIIKIILQFIETRIVENTDTEIDDIVIDLLDKFTGILVYTAAAIIALDILGANIMPFIAGAGVAGIAIGFAAKDTLSNLIAGILLLIDRPFETGDRIEVWSAPRGSSTWGDVVDIGLRATKIRTTDNIEIIIPNNEIMKRDIINYTSTSSAIRVRINIGVAYDSDITKAKEVIINIARSIEWIQKEPAPKVVVRNFGESSVDLQLRVWIQDARKRMDTISNVTDLVKDGFAQSGIEIPYPKRDITLINKTEPQK